MQARFVVPGSKLYRRLLRRGWRDTGYRRWWCGGELVTVLMVWEG